MSLRLRPWTVKRETALAFNLEVHRKLKKIQGAMWCVSIRSGSEVVGVALVGWPSQEQTNYEMDHLRVLRCTVKEGHKNGCSMLYGACWRAAAQEPSAQATGRCSPQAPMVGTRQREVESQGMRPRGIKWDEQPLGRVPDTELAARLGVVQSAVTDARRRRGIAPCPRGHVERRGGLPLLGTMPDAQIAVRLGLPTTAIRDARRRRGIRMDQARVAWEHIDPLLGTRPDAQLAREQSVSVAAINDRRTALGIPRYAPECKCACCQTFRASFRWQRFCSTICAYAGRHGRRHGGYEELSVALWALRRSIRRISNGH